MEYNLSIVIPSRHEEFLNKTIEDILKNKEGKTQIIVGLDGEWPLEPIPSHPDVVVLYYPESIGQRAITNQCVRLSTAKFICKTDAHCAFDKGFDIKMMKLMEPDITMIPVMRNLHAFDWVCPEGHRRYQGPSGLCTICGKPTTKDIVWIAKTNPQSIAYRFDKTMHFQYWNEYGRKQTGDLTETLSIQGSCFMITRDKYWELDICSETFNSWGQQGVEVACKTWLSGGRVLVNRTTWYAHMFRTQGGDFGFPYPLSGHDVQKNRDISKELFEKNKWTGSKYPFNWLLNKFHPPEWEEQPPTKGILYYTDNCLNMRFANEIRNKLVETSGGLHITSVSLKRMKFGDNFHIHAERGYATMFKQILLGLENMKEDIVFFCEHDVLYHPDHFAFTPTNKNTWYYNGNYWFLRLKDGFSIHYDVSPLSGLVVYRETALAHFRERVKMIEELGEEYKPIHMGFEPFTHGRVKWKFWCPFEVFMPQNPNIDITHTDNSTWKRWNQKDFIKKPIFWEESTDYTIPFWPKEYLIGLSKIKNILGEQK
jgi:glycosyltransferase involved in cell wall biosynthesis